MKKTSIRLGLAVAFSALLFTACKKDDEAAPASLTKESIAGKYKLTDAQIVPPVGPTYSVYTTYLKECERDDIYTLNTDFSAKYEDAGKACEGTSPKTTTWKLEGKNITVQGGTLEFIGVVNSWDGSTLVIDGGYELGGVTVKIRGTLVKQ
ncbi:lipocalin family protein [Paraflavitalea pollutisoli]|uniref:lipocalin family protein n=1 Tax=Paraflavitalea pollutisoli TaxID=3034143 RepID=UPI0023EDD06C|nr:lipocalin family protein [Paraflavitalea sp. H1-2-19X]